MFSLHRSYFLVNSLCEYHVKSRGDHFLFGFFLLVWIFILLLLWTAFPCPVHWRWCCSLLFPSPLLSLSPLPPLSHLHSSSFFPMCDQTQTQLEHARIRELEQSLLFEKAQAEKLLRELEDTRVIAPTCPACRAARFFPVLMLMTPCFGFLFWFVLLIGFGLNLGFPGFCLVWFLFALSLLGVIALHIS